MIDQSYPLGDGAAPVAVADPCALLTPGARLRGAHLARRDRAADVGAVSADPWAAARPGDMELLRRLHAERTAR